MLQPVLPRKRPNFGLQKKLFHVADKVLGHKKSFPTSATKFWVTKKVFQRRQQSFGSQKKFSNVSNKALGHKKSFPTSAIKFWLTKKGFPRKPWNFGSMKLVRNADHGILFPQKGISTSRTKFWKPARTMELGLVRGGSRRGVNFGVRRPDGAVGNGALVPPGKPARR